MITSNKTIAAAVLGINGMGATHVQAAKDSPWINRVMGYEPTSELASKYSIDRDIPATHHINKILNDPQIKLVYIAAPNEFHCDLAIQAINAGKAVLCEKPMGTTLNEATRLLQAKQNKDSFLQIGLELRYSKLYMQAKEWIDQGLIGTPVNTHCDYYCSEGHARGSWRSESETSLIAEKLCHYLDLPRWWIGDEVKNVYSVSAPNVVSYFNHPDNHQITYRFKDGAVSTLAFFMHTAESFDGDPLQDIIEKQVDDGHRLTYLIYGTAGAIETDVFRRRIRRWEFKDAPAKLESKLVDKITYPSKEDSLWMHNTHGQNIEVSRLVAHGLPPFTEASDSFQSMKLVFAAERSELEGQVVEMSEV
ncbi:MAG: Gfo/Idh/MocA family oxidoreductase [Phycisphaeraceae bacterium]|nr:Gfo/Idh/MocA family oxidoreductase [Phycisphaeraceae bacterium]